MWMSHIDVPKTCTMLNDKTDTLIGPTCITKLQSVHERLEGQTSCRTDAQCHFDMHTFGRIESNCIFDSCEYNEVHKTL